MAVISVEAARDTIPGLNISPRPLPLIELARHNIELVKLLPETVAYHLLTSSRPTSSHPLSSALEAVVAVTDAVESLVDLSISRRNNHRVAISNVIAAGSLAVAVLQS
jgi:hypothetical protein